MKTHPNLQLSSYQFHLPEELIAHVPLEKRDESRLLVVRRGAIDPILGGLSPESVTFEHRFIKDLPEILNKNHLLVANNTKVFKARLLGHRVNAGSQDPGGKVEFFLLKKRRADGLLWQGLMKSSARITPGFQFKIGEVRAEVIERVELRDAPQYVARFEQDPTTAGLGEVPLPPYITARRKSLNPDAQNVNGKVEVSRELEEYNTLFSKVEGSVAAPTAGRHFTPELIRKLKFQGTDWLELTLHVGMGTFKPVVAEDISQHEMHAESAMVSLEIAARINEARAQGRKIIAVGTTSSRTLEGFADPATGLLTSGEKEVNLFIHPGPESPEKLIHGYPWKIVDGLLTNFHLPESSLLMMVADFLGSRTLALKIYEEAIREKYRFYSYGDAMLILE